MPCCNGGILPVAKATKFDRYQDYVIKDGELVGDFEEMYQDFEDPWEQCSSDRDATDKVIGLDLLERNGHERALEYGCGLGRYTDHLCRRLGAAAGVDISDTAVAKARQLHPGSDFYVGDILGSDPVSEFKPDVLVFCQVTWYVLDELAAFKELLPQLGAQSFLHLLEVYPPGRQSYGTDYFVDLHGILDYWSEVIDFQEWGEICRKEDLGGARTFFYGQIK